MSHVSQCAGDNFVAWIRYPGEPELAFGTPIVFNPDEIELLECIAAEMRRSPIRPADTA